MKTKFGNIGIDSNGYYRVTSSKEENQFKRLHRLIWEDHYKTEIPDGYVIHHINGDKLDNRIQNLQCVEDTIHKKYHNRKEKNPMYGITGENNPLYGIPLNDEVKKKISETKKGRFCGDKNPRARKVRCIETGEIFNTIIEAAEAVGLKTAKHITSVCRGKRKHSGGYGWEYIN